MMMIQEVSGYGRLIYKVHAQAATILKEHPELSLLHTETFYVKFDVCGLLL